MLYTTLITLLYALAYLLKRMAKTILLLLILLPAREALAQNSWRLAYFGETLTHYGFRVARDQHLSKTIYLGASFSAYRHPGNHLGALLAPEIGWRYSGKRGLFLQSALSAGLYRSFYEGATYTPRAEGGFKKIPLAGQWGFMPGFSVGAGYDFLPEKKKNWALYCQLHYLRQYLHKAALELGVLKRFNHEK
jgi:hypothetical protein